MNIQVADEHPSSGVDADLIRTWAEATLLAERYPSTTEVAVTLLPDAAMAIWHQDVLGESGPTDVLSFPVETLRPGQIPLIDERGPPLLIGDVVIAPDYVRQQAREMKVDPDDELALMITHGILHLLGYDHEKDDEAAQMEDRERQILASLGRSRR